MKLSFYQEFDGWTLTGKEHLMLTCVHANGETVDELIENATVHIEDWNGGEGPNWKVGDLPQSDFDAIESLLRNFVGGVKQ